MSKPSLTKVRTKRMILKSLVTDLGVVEFLLFFGIPILFILAGVLISKVV